MRRIEPYTGSAFQLLRFLGYRRHELNREISRQTQINPDLDYNLEWLDAPRNRQQNSLDDVYEGIDFFPQKMRGQLSGNWTAYWPQTGTHPNWDAVLYCGPGIPESKPEKWIVVEAKAELNEIRLSTGADDNARVVIGQAFAETQKRFGIQTKNSWFDTYYQLAYRLAFVNFLLVNGIEGALLTIYFINGCPDKPGVNVTSRAGWEVEIQAEYDYLGINEAAKKYISDIFVDCG